MPDRAPDAVGLAEGWRVWTLDLRGRLCSLFHEERWRPLCPTTARCEHGHAPPAEECACGIYAAATPAQLRGHGYHLPTGDEVLVVGQVALWGGLVEGEHGWRAEHGYPRRLWLPYEHWTRAAALRRAYGTPVGLINPFTWE